MKVSLTLTAAMMKEVELLDSLDLDEEAHNEPSHLDLHCLPFSL